MPASRHWLVVFDRQQHGQPTLEYPTTAEHWAADIERLEQQYPLPRYTVSHYSSTEPVESGIAEANSWDASDYFSDLAEAERERRPDHEGAKPDADE